MKLFNIVIFLICLPIFFLPKRATGQDLRFEGKISPMLIDYAGDPYYRSVYGFRIIRNLINNPPRISGPMLSMGARFYKHFKIGTEFMKGKVRFPGPMIYGEGKQLMFGVELEFSYPFWKERIEVYSSVHIGKHEYRVEYFSRPDYINTPLVFSSKIIYGGLGVGSNFKIYQEFYGNFNLTFFPFSNTDHFETFGYAYKQKNIMSLGVVWRSPSLDGVMSKVRGF